MSTEENKTQFRRMYDEFFNQGNLAVADELLAPDFISHGAPGGAPNRGPGPMQQLVTMLHTAFPDIHFTVEELVAEGDTVAGRVTMTATHQGPYMGIAPTNRTVRQAQMHFMRFADGKAVERHTVRDDLTLMQQLGAIPSPPRNE